MTLHEMTLRLFILCLPCLFMACGSDDAYDPRDGDDPEADGDEEIIDGDTSQTDGDAADSDAADGDGSEVEIIDGDGGTDGDIDGDGDGDVDGQDTEYPSLTAEDIAFEVLDPPLEGDVIYYNSWNGGADTLEMISPDGERQGTRFQVHRLWSFGMAHDGITVVFSSLDPYQEEHFGITFGDATQNSWIFRDGAPPEMITHGPINDEGHRFSPDDEAIYLCRRANFKQEDMNIENDPYRILRIDLSDLKETWLTPLVAMTQDIGPVLRDDGSILFWRQDPGFNQSMMSMNADGSDIQELLAGATGPATSIDGKSVLFRRTWKSLSFGDAHDPASALTIIQSDQGFSSIAISPDKNRIVYLMGRDDSSCSDLWIAKADGSEKTRLVDCAAEDKFPTKLSWRRVE